MCRPNALITPQLFYVAVMFIFKNVNIMITRKYSGGNALIHTMYCTNQKLQTEAVTSVKHQIKKNVIDLFLK